jgi:hypothetical protein
LDNQQNTQTTAGEQNDPLQQRAIEQDAPSGSASPPPIEQCTDKQNAPTENVVNQNTTDTSLMEVHHHPKVEKKNFKEYFLECLMIFLSNETTR